VRIIDIDAEGLTQEKFIVELKKKPYGLVGMTTTTPTFHKAVALAKIVKDHAQAATVLGGIHATILPEDSLAPDAVDYVVKGEGEQTLLELVNCLEKKGNPALIDGLYYKSSGALVRNKDRALIANLDELPFPARHFYNSLNYRYPDALLSPAMPIITSRGCPAACTYCDSRSVFTRRFRARSVQNIVQELEELVRAQGVKEIHIWDDNFTTIKERVYELRDVIAQHKLNIKFAFPNGLRADYVNKELLQALKDMGAYSVAFGVDSGNQRVLDKVNKHITLAQIEHAFTLAKSVGLETRGFFMIGLPDDTPESIRDTVEFAVKLNPDVVKFHILKPFPGTSVYEEFVERGLLLDEDFDNFGFHMPPVHRLDQVSREELIAWHKRAYRRFYLRPQIILAQILRLYSWHRAKLNINAAIGLLRNMW